VPETDLARDLEDYCPIPTLLVTHGRDVEFDVYLGTSRTCVLYARAGDFTPGRRRSLYEKGAEQVFIHKRDRSRYDRHVQDNFASLLEDPSIDVRQRGKLLYDHSCDVARKLFGEKDGDQAERFKAVDAMVSRVNRFLSADPMAMKALSGLVSHHHHTWSHCLNVMVYTLAVMAEAGHDKATSHSAGIGATLHDIGKTRVSRAILDKPGRPTPDEWEVIRSHPGAGVVACAGMRLDPGAFAAILSHHEKLDGSGYPDGRVNIPEHVRIVTIADIFDALTSKRAYNEPSTPFAALSIVMKDVKAGRLDKDAAAAFVKVLGEGGFTV
jgi:HD-GYP domain-containing protein (c-di-GMP phosphodiesterase class II)